MDVTRLVGSEQKRTDIAEFNVGDTVRVHVRITEGDRQRVQPFEGIVISRRGSGTNETFTVRRISFGEGVERVFPTNSPLIDKIEMVRYGKTRRSKLYYLRERVGKSVRVKRGTGPRKAKPQNEQ